MIYVISDLHGYPLEKFKKLLEKAEFSADDFLYILGDVIDRNGDGGVEMLLWLMEQENIELLLGNHEAMLLSCSFVFDEITEKSIEKMSSKDLSLLSTYTRNGGEVTLSHLRALSPETRDDILDYLRNAPLYEAITVGENDFILVHAGIGNFSPDKRLSEYTTDELIWERPNIKDHYFDDIITVFGHTPTLYYGNEFDGKILKTKTWIDIDAYASGGREPVLLRLDDFKEFKL